MDSELKYRREKFIHGNNGSKEPWEIFGIILILQLSHILYESFLFAVPCLRQQQYAIKFLRIILDFVCIYSPFILSVTIYHEYISNILFTISLLIMMNFIIYIKNNSNQICWQNIPQQSIKYPDSKRFTYISNMMSSLLLATCIAIFAVDFPIFDRRFSKTELYGWSLMDIGVGCFIAINGALSYDSRFKNVGFKTSFSKTLRSSIPLLVLGIIRLIAVKMTNYQEHVSEYGVHWNFFFTISFVKILSCLICAIFVERINLYKISLVIMVLQQIMLKVFGTEFIVNESNRSMNFFASNKEGLLSLPGFVAIYIFFIEVGRNYIPKREKISEKLTIILQLTFISLKSLTIMFASHHLLEPVSRREANLSFICFIMFCSCLNITVEVIYFVWLQIMKPNFNHESFCFNLINRNGLYIFLIANIITGLVQLSVDTMILNNSISLLLIHFYGILLTIFGHVFDKIFKK